MFQKQWVADNMAKDCRTTIHLFQRIPAALHDWRPSPGQRSVEELLRYLSVCAISALRGFREPGAGWRDVYAARSKEYDLVRFPEAMESQAQQILEYFRDLPDEELATRTVSMPWGETMFLGEAILGAAYKWLPAYKMQLFLYAKANGIALSTPNLWRGVDPVPPPA